MLTSITIYKAKVKKNVDTDIVGDKVGRIHLGRQDLSDLQTRKMKGLKRGRDADVDGDIDLDAGGSDDISLIDDDEGADDGIAGGVEVKRQRIA